jgi:hypothetical protein
MTEVMTPAGVSVLPKMTVREALNATAAQLRKHTGPMGPLLTAMQLTGAPAGVRFHALAALRTVVLGSPDAGDLSGKIANLSREEVAALCEKAAGL